MKRTTSVLALACGAAGLGTILALSATAQAPVPIPNIWLQSSTPGTVQTGHGNISGTFASTNMLLKGGTFVGTIAGLPGYRLLDNVGGYASVWQDSALGFAVAMGTSSDDSGFLEMYSKAGPLTAFLEGDADNNGANGIETGALMLRSVGTGGPGGEIRVLNNDGTETFDVLGGASAAHAVMAMYGLTGTTTAQMRGDDGTQGGAFYLNEENGQYYTFVEPDADGTGAFFLLTRDTGLSGLIYQNNGPGNPTFNLFGPTSSIAYDGGVAGDGSVSLPNDAVSAAEILNEAGVAGHHIDSVALGAAYAPIISRTITVPTAGYVLAIGQGDVDVSHVTGTTTYVLFGVSMASNSLPTHQDITFGLAGGAPSGNYLSSGAASGIFSVAAGTHTFYYVARQLSGAGSSTMFDVNLSLLFVPTAYGTVTTNFTGGGGDEGAEDSGSEPNNRSNIGQPMTEDEIQQEKDNHRLEQGNRVAEELAQMKAQMAHMQMRMNQLIQQQGANNKAVRKAQRPKTGNVSR